MFCRKKSAITALLLFLSLIARASTTDTPGPRYGHSLAYLEIQRSLLLFGGFHNDGAPLPDTWIKRGANWKRLYIPGPSARKWPAMTYDSKRERVLLFGGRSGQRQQGDSLSDTWIFENGDWRQLDVNGPTKRDHHAMIYDKQRDRVVMFGGWDGEKLLGDTWEFDGTSWTQIASKGPTARAPVSLAYDEPRKNIVLFGGKDLTSFFSDTWIWDGESWIELDVPGPSPRAFHGMVYLPTEQHVILFSGRHGNTMFNDTWAWNGQSWRLLSDRGPVKRGVHILAYDSASESAVFYGSGKRVDGKWYLDHELWRWRNEEWLKKE